MMTGHNHHPGCSCGWCLNYGRGGSAVPVYQSSPRTATFSTYASRTIPNACCPVCGQTVFFHQSPFGGRVFFDELGPPWPKHPCTDNPRLSVSPARQQSRRIGTAPGWHREGWDPIRLSSTRMEGSWYVMRVESLTSRLHFDVLLDEPFKAVGETCAYMRQWNQHGWSEISVVDLDAGGAPKLIEIFARKAHFGTSRMAAVGRRQSASRT